MTTPKEIQAQLLTETARCPFVDLQRFFAQGVLLRVVDELDMLEVGAALVADDSKQFQRWLDSGNVVPLEDEVAAQWLANDVAPWTCVVKPWVLVQAHRSSERA